MFNNKKDYELCKSTVRTLTLTKKSTWHIFARNKDKG